MSKLRSAQMLLVMEQLRPHLARVQHIQGGTEQLANVLEQHHTFWSQINRVNIPSKKIHIREIAQINHNLANIQTGDFGYIVDLAHHSLGVSIAVISALPGDPTIPPPPPPPPPRII